jgi:L-threonylcarbamoyladenylate synthase
LKRLIKISDKEVVRVTAEVLKGGGVVIFPTDTLYGLLGIVESLDALNRIADIKGRNESKPFPIFVSSFEMAERYIVCDERIKTLFSEFLPGPLTIVARAKREIPFVTSQDRKIGVRIPNVRELIEIVSLLDVAVTGTSANFSGKQAPRSFEEIDPELVRLVDLVVDGGILYGIPSTVFDAVDLKVIREGAIDGEAIYRSIRGY